MSGGILINAFGGLAIFLLAMLMMTEGLTVFAGGELRQLLGRWTSTPLRGRKERWMPADLTDSPNPRSR